MKGRFAALAAAAALLGAAGCARVMVRDSDAGDYVSAPVLKTPVPVSVDEPAFCLISIRPAAGASADAVSRRGGAATLLAQIRRAGPFRSFRPLTSDHPGLAECDVLVRASVDDQPDLSGVRIETMEAYSAYTGKALWQAWSSARAPVLVLARSLHAAFQPGTRAFRTLAADRATEPRLTTEAFQSWLKPHLTTAFDYGLGPDDFPPGTAAAPAAPAASAAAAPAAPAATPRPAAARTGLDDLPPARAPDPHAYAVVVGVERYREGLPDARYAAADARLTAKYFERVLGVPPENLALLTDDRATKGDFEKYFERWLPNRVEAGDAVYVYYSGHGAPDPAKGDAYLVPYDGDPTYIGSTGFATSRLFRDLGKLPAKSVFVAMDSCFSGAGGRSVIARDARPLVSVVEGGLPANATVLSASAADQISNSDASTGHGLFTYYFLEGLKTEGPDLKAVYDYLRPKVARAARVDDNADQTPVWRAGR
jgi:hypothetical protein